MNDLSRLLDPEQAAEKLGISATMVRRYCKDGRLESTVRNGRYYIDPEALKRFKRRGKGRPRNPAKPA